MRVLGIETSCDETAAAVIEDGTKILSNVVASSSKMHSETGGIIPEKAARAQVGTIIPVIELAILDAAKSLGQSIHRRLINQWAKQNLDSIAVTAGPGLIGSLLVGVEASKSLSWVWKKPLVPVVHTLAHVYANWLTSPQPPKLPAIVLTVSGGHSDLLVMRNHGNFEFLGGTRDDTAGEAFDKTARFLGLSYPGGPAIQKAASLGNPNTIKLPRPLINSGDFDLSFSGLKTAVIRAGEQKGVRNVDLAAATQSAICDVLVSKTLRAIRKFGVKSLLLAGGVAANHQLRDSLEKKSPVPMRTPPIALCTDNGAFIASYAFFNYQPMPWRKIKAESDTHGLIEKYANSKNKSK
jgi:N6-L-threonylcarbamoyladenine synthase